jgi:hypothetical protein
LPDFISVRMLAEIVLADEPFLSGIIALLKASLAAAVVAAVASPEPRLLG